MNPASRILLTRSALLLATSCLASGLQADVIWDNGPLVTHVAGMGNGADRDALYTGSVNLGFAAQTASSNRVADDFTIGTTTRDLTTARFFTYQSGSTTTSTITGITLQIWNGTPGSSSVVWGDEVTNVMSGTGFTGVYRTSPTDSTSTNRPIMYVDVNLTGLSLPAGTYWVDFNFSGTLGSGPWVPSLSSPTGFVTGNALQKLGAAGLYNNVSDNPGPYQVGLPFVIQGTSAIPEPASSAALLGVGVIAVAALRRRRR